MSDVASLTREEAARRFDLVSVERYDVTVDLRGLYEGDVWAATSTISFTCREPGAETFVDCVGTATSVTLNGQELDPATAVARPHPAARPPRRQRAGRQLHPVRHPQRPRDPEDRRPQRQARLRLVDLRARHGTLRLRLLRPARPQGTPRLRGRRARELDGHQQLRPRHGRGPRRRRPALDVRRHAPALDVRHRRERRAVPRAALRARRLRPRPLLPAVAQAVHGARRRGAVRPHRPRPGVLRRAVRSAVPPGPLRPGLRAQHGRRDGELGLGHVDRQRPLPQHADLRPARRTRADPAARDGPHVVRRPRHDALVGRPLAQRGVRLVGVQLGRRQLHRVHRRVGDLPGRQQDGRLPPGHVTGHPPDPRRRARRRAGDGQLRRDHLYQGCERAEAAHGLRRRGRLRGGAAGLLPRARLGQHRPRRPHVGDRRGRRARPLRVDGGLARPGRHRHPPPRRRRHRRRLTRLGGASPPPPHHLVPQRLRSRRHAGRRHGGRDGGHVDHGRASRGRPPPGQRRRPHLRRRTSRSGVRARAPRPRRRPAGRGRPRPRRGHRLPDDVRR